MDSTKPLPNPFSPYTKLSLKIMEPFKDTTLYLSIAGALQYATVSSHELAFLVNKVCKYMHNPSKEHWAVVKQILVP